MDQIYLNFYFFGSLLASLFALYVSLFFLTIKDRSKAAFHLGISSLATFVFHLGYVIGFVSYEEWSIFHRWIVIPTPMIGYTQLLIFFFYFPQPKRVKLGLSVYALLYLGVILTTGFYVIASLQSVRTFVMGSHYWDFETHLFYKLFSLLVLIYNVSFLVAGIWRAVGEKGKERRSVIYIMLSYCVITILPGIANALSRDGSISRAAYQQVADLGLVTGLFLILVVYVNTTKERTTILSRIVGITMATFLLVFQLVGYAVLNGYEASFDQIKIRETKLVVMDKEKPEGFAYEISYDPSNDVFETEQGTKDPRFAAEDKLEVRFFHFGNLLTNLGTLPAGQRLEKSKSILKEAPKEFYGYREAILQFLSSKKEAEVSDAEMISFFHLLRKKLSVIRSKFSHLPKKNDQAAIGKLFQSEEIGLSEMLGKVKSKINDEIERGKSETDISVLTLSSLAVIRDAGERIYRGTKFYNVGDQKPVFYVAYYFVHPKNGKIYEVGFHYKTLRAFLHEPSLVLVASLIAVILIVSIGFRFFFQYALIVPMDEVVVGLTEVNSGNLDYRLVPRVEDEIGFIARSFNRMARSIQAARKRLEQYANELEEKVKERTKELEQTLGEVRELKQQQDGDYFLTSLLIKPLGSNKAIQENVKVDFLMEQKKKFTFRRYKDEIGGDLNISNHIELHDRSYTVFLNADAMGKSMQGAGGALVLGAVFESIIERTRIVESMRAQSPERWLKNAFTELHKVFESFDGSMLVSSVIGLIDDEVGVLYFINAEHPWTVLYRDGIASFIEDELMFRKLGTTGMEGRIFIKTFQLEPGDVIIAGSDGRDDILIGTDAEGGRIINDDERLFLRLVEEAKGDLKEIYNGILRKGHLTDDLSLIRLSFKEADPEQRRIEEEQKEKVRELLKKAKDTSQNKEIDEAIAFLEQAESLNSRIPEVKKNFIRLFLKMKNYSKAARYAEDYLNIKPVDKEILYVASFAARKAGQLRKALDFGERLLLREPDHLKNLMNLAQVYIALKNYDRAMVMTHSALRLDPDNEAILKTRDVLRKYIDRKPKANENLDNRES
ncbi:SpoIIE-like protein phosphatase domain protein [Leptospira inadai serovar Lyme str. 10]|uniref:SpoIIE-like protein phosphatase domain protein n=2 Tax=Leptospira inadai serovar Lyme TaxID=293084 RepID=V6HRR6_9LEPT|nr:PP2C family protein-serine/threonine phosphatase [Leptospira inadai]EQA35229.1 SpoIIE-like protein phosphatase domain protein [Leptospira inadai serovar Lyme str. 10]PNV76044.1 stage II sporulation protein E [Leptospira inadai serovar Lyme]